MQDAVHDAEEVDLDDAAPVFGAEIFGGSGEADAGVVVERVDAALARDELGDDAFEGGGVGDVELHGAGAGDFGGGLFGAGEVAIREDHAGASGSELCGERGADAGGGTGDERDFTGKRALHSDAGAAAFFDLVDDGAFVGPAAEEEAGEEAVAAGSDALAVDEDVEDTRRAGL